MVPGMIPVGCVAGKHPENKGWMLAAQPLHATEMRKSHEQGKPPDRLEAWQSKGMGKEAGILPAKIRSCRTMASRVDFSSPLEGSVLICGSKFENYDSFRSANIGTG